MVFPFEYHAENPAYKRTAEENLPEEGHWEITDECLKPYRNKFDSRMFEDHSSPEAHNRAHEATVTLALARVIKIGFSSPGVTRRNAIFGASRSIKKKPITKQTG